MSNLLTFYDRERIEYYLHFKRLSLRHIAKLIGRDHTVVMREIRRNKAQLFPYNALLAQRAAERKLGHNRRKKLDRDKNLYDYVVTKLAAGWSPEQIAGRLNTQFPISPTKQKLCAETIYRYIYDEGVDYGGVRLFHYLRRKNSFRQKHYARAPQKAVILGRVSIHQRPREINIKAAYGHWESDTVICKYRRPVSVQYERKSMLVRINKVKNMSSEETKEAILKTIDSLPLHLIKSITYDNGRENCKHTDLKRDFDIQTYFCDPYASWQKGGIENINGLIRQYLPRQTDLTKIPDEYIHLVQERLNNRPRKSLNYLTPNEIIEKESGALKSRT